jgi:hypothetical protein
VTTPRKILNYSKVYRPLSNQLESQPEYFTQPLMNAINALSLLNIPEVIANYKVLPPLSENALVPIAFPGEKFRLDR